MSEPDAWAELQALKQKRDSRRRKLEERKKERHINSSNTSQFISFQNNSTLEEDDGEAENAVLSAICDSLINLPVDSKEIHLNALNKSTLEISHERVCYFLQKFALQNIIRVVEKKSSGMSSILEIVSGEESLLLNLFPSPPKKLKDEKDDINSLLSLSSTREKERKRVGEEILELLSRPTAKEKTLVDKFRSQGGTSVREFCPHGTKDDCVKVSLTCDKVHFRKIIQIHTDESLGDCSFLNTCFHMESCKYVHYEVDKEEGGKKLKESVLSIKSETKYHAPQWIHCDLRFFNMSILGKFSVIMADPPWDIHMELPYGTLSDDEMRQLSIPALQDEGLIFLWVTGRAMELGRECLELWGYERVDELIWVKTNQLQRIIRTGRTGHWLNHGKEHCLVGMKGSPVVNRGIDADVIVAEVRATSHKPDEIYGIIERLSPGTRKIELFGRSHNIQPNWVTLGNQLEGSHLVDEDLIKRFYLQYPDGNCLKKPN